MVAYLIRRILLAVPTLLGVTLLVSCVLYLAPGSPAEAILGERSSPERVEAINKKYGLDQPFYIQYFRFVGGAVQGDLGESPATGRQVGDDLAHRFPATVELTLVALALAVFFGLLLGLLSAVNRERWPDVVAMTGALVGVSFPIFFLGMILINLCGGFLPGGGRLGFTSMPPKPFTGMYLFDVVVRGNFTLIPEVLKHLILPAIALATVPMGIIARMTRSATIEVLGSDYIRTARAKGAGHLRVVVKHALRNASIPIVTVIGLQLGYLLAGAVLTETIFSWPGIGSYVFDSIQKRDIIAVRGAVLVIAVTFIAVNLFVDLVFSWLDPRIRYG